MIHSVFELGETLSREVMVPRTDMVFIERHKTLRQALSLGLRSGFSRIPVIGDNEDDVVGVVYLKDVAKRVFDHRESESTQKVESVMRPAFFVPDSRRGGRAARRHAGEVARTSRSWSMSTGRRRPGHDRGHPRRDRGEITDEYDVDQGPSVERLDDGSLRVSARLHVDDLAEELDIMLDDEVLEDVETVGGLLAKYLGKVPIPGATVDVAGLEPCRGRPGRRNQVGTILVRPVATQAVDAPSTSGNDNDVSERQEHEAARD